MKAVILAGGEGSRLRPLTVNRPKPMVPVCNRPILEHILGLLKLHGFQEAVVALHFLGDEIERYFGDGADLGVRLSYSLEEAPLGTAGCVKLAEDQLRGTSNFLVISGDALTDCDLTSAMEAHVSSGADATLILARVSNPLEYGIVVTDEDGRVVRFQEKPTWSEVFSDTVNTGMYILKTSVLDLLNRDENVDWSKDIFPRMLAEGMHLQGHVMSGFWADVGSLENYREVQSQMLTGMVDLPIAGSQRKDHVWVGEGTVIDAGAELVPPVCIGREVRIRAGARIGPHAVIGDRSIVEENSVFERSVALDHTYLGYNSHIVSSILGSRVTVKRDVRVMEEAVIGDRCLLDVGATVRPKVKLWPDKQIERGATINMSLIWGQRWRQSLFRDLGVAGISNIEITPEFATRLGAAFGSVLPVRGKVVTSRDSTRSSRMIKRAVIASLLSVGCDVLDLRSTPMPILRHFVRSSGAVGAINVRKQPENPRVTLMELLDSNGAYVATAMERKIENAFFREDFARVDSEDLGSIEFAGRATEEYQADFHHRLSLSGVGCRIVCDYGYSAISAILPAMLARLGIESVSLNAFNNARAAPRTPDQIHSHIGNVRQIASSLGYDLGVLFTGEGERMTVVDDLGRVLSGYSLLGVFCALVADAGIGPVVLPATAPQKLDRLFIGKELPVRVRADTPSLIRASAAGVAFAADEHGGFCFPELHPGFDAAFALCKLLTLLEERGEKLSAVVDSIPSFDLAFGQVPCDWDQKGAVMRILAEQAAEGGTEPVEGIRLADGDAWILIRPDTLEPTIHIQAEGAGKAQSTELVNRYRQRVLDILKG